MTPTMSPSAMGECFAVESRDGVAISVQKSGSGPPLLLIHGAAVDSSAAWSRVLPMLTERFTVYAMNRRGRPPSGDAQPHALPAEVEDLAAVVNSMPEPFTLLAHSFGGLITLAALDRLKNVNRLILYEPPVFEFPRAPRYQRILESLDRALESGDREEVVTIFLRDQVGTDESILARLRASPIWEVFKRMADTLPRESRAVNTFQVDRNLLGQWRVPTTMLLGGESPDEVRDGAMFICRSIPGCRLVILEEQGHSAMLSAPEFFAARVIELAVGQA
jgi:pimeloyl-ACP methyl ester carboxylesterase